MNSMQRVVVILCAVAIVASFTYVPWTIVRRGTLQPDYNRHIYDYRHQEVPEERRLMYSPVWQPPETVTDETRLTEGAPGTANMVYAHEGIYWQRIMKQIPLCLVFGFLFFMLFRGRKPKSDPVSPNPDAEAAVDVQD